MNFHKPLAVIAVVLSALVSGIHAGSVQEINDPGQIAAMLGPHMETIRAVIFTKHFDLGGSHYAYTEALTTAAAERNFQGGDRALSSGDR